MTNPGPSPMFFTRAGKTQTLYQWAEELGVSYFTLYSRIRTLGIPAERALDPNFKRRALGPEPKRYTHAGKTLTVRQWAGELGISEGQIRYRLKAGYPVDVALSRKLPPVERDWQGHHPLTLNDATHSMAEWSRRSGIPVMNISVRIGRLGWTVERALTEPVCRKALPGVSSDLEAFEGTGAGSTAQEIPEITFSKQADNA